MQMAFLGAICLEKSEQKDLDFRFGLLLAIGLVLLLAHGKKKLHQSDFSPEEIQSALGVPIGTAFCYGLHIGLDLGPVLSAACVGVVASFIPGWFPEKRKWATLPAALYCGAFVGMSSPLVLGTFPNYLVAGGLAGLGFWASRTLFSGIGGKLGTLAFAAVVMVVWLKNSLWNNF